LLVQLAAETQLTKEFGSNHQTALSDEVQSKAGFTDCRIELIIRNLSWFKIQSLISTGLYFLILGRF
jgi:hypothetical protein